MATIEDIQSRLRTAVDDADTKIAFLFGAGMSAGIVPGVEQMIDHFVGVLPRAEQVAVRQKLQLAANVSERYQQAAELVLSRGGRKRVRAALAKATLSACVGEPVEIDQGGTQLTNEESRALEYRLKWRLGRAHEGFARFYSSMPPGIRGPIFTTNFDPLLEVALREVGLPADPIVVSGSTVPTAEQLVDFAAVPITHLHGYWRSANSLHTPSQLNSSRVAVARSIRDRLSNTILVVVGYGGWNDIFMRELVAAFTEGQLYDSEVLWASFSSNESTILQNPDLASMIGLPGFNLYLGVDANELFQIELNPLNLDAEISGGTSKIAPIGFSIVSPTSRLVEAQTTGDASSDFVNGDSPSWFDAMPASWPMLSATIELGVAVRKVLDAGGGGGAVAIGPIGEGKSLGLMQVAVQVATERPDWTVLWREHGSPSITNEWLVQAKERYGKVCLCIDDADLVANELAVSTALWSQDGSGIALLLASHDRLWWKASLANGGKVSPVLFHGITPSDAHNIATTWGARGLLPTAYASYPVDEAVKIMGEKLRMASIGVEGLSESTLMGAVLTTRFSSGLKGRVSDLIDKFTGEEVSKTEDITMADVFGCICLVQSTFDPDGIRCVGASKELLAAIVDLHGTFPDAKILTLLGREALVSFVGGRVYSRHSSIAKVVVDVLRSRGRLDVICGLTGRAAARLKSSSVVDRAAWAEPYNLSKELPHFSEAMAAANGVLDGAPGSFAARLDRIRVLRKFDPQGALTAARTTLAHRNEFHDSDETIRIFLNELARCAIRCEQPELALGAAAIGLGGEFRYPLDSGQGSYFFKSFMDAGMQLRKQNVQRSRRIPEVSASLASRLFVESVRNKIANRSVIEELASPLRDQSFHNLLGIMQSDLNDFAGRVRADLELGCYLPAVLNFGWITSPSSRDK